MKVAVVFSGLVRGDVDYIFNQWNNILKENTDIFCTTWKDEPPRDFIDEYIEYPEVNYNPHNVKMRRVIHELRTKNWPADHIEKTKHKLNKWFKKRHERNDKLIYQHYIYARSLQILDIYKKYDVIVRARYDMPLNMNTQEFYNMCYECYYDDVIFSLGDDSLRNKGKKHGHYSRHTAADLTFIHKPHHFDYTYCFDLIKRKRLPGEEWGWRMLFRPPGTDPKTFCSFNYVVYKTHDENYNYTL